MLVGTQSGKINTFIVRSGIFAGSVTLALGLLGASPALAQSCGDFGTAMRGLLAPVFGASVSGGLAISSAVTAAHTAFLSQGTAFVGAPASPRPDSEGSGIWIRSVGGELTVNSNTSVGASINSTGHILQSGADSTTCGTKFQQTFGGFQLGHDVAKLNVGGWNLTLGTTAGFLETTGHIVGGNVTGGAFNSTTQAPFVGTYGVAAFGNFSIDGLIQYDHFQTNLDSPTADFFNQKIGAHGFTAAASAGYNWNVPNSNWVIEPRAGVVWSRETVDPLDAANNPFPGTHFRSSGTTQFNTIESVIGRVGVRVGTTVETANVVYQPFAAASVWHDFGRGLTANYSTCPICSFENASFSANFSTNNVGTFGQYSLGVSAQIKDTGWLGFARVDYREGSEIRGVSGAGGIRYQFTPTEAASVMPLKEKAPAWADHPVNWTGLYVGGFGGAQYGRGSMAFPASQTFSGSTADIRPSGWVGGGTLGYNYQTGRWVLGVEGDFAGTNANGSQQCAPLAQDPLFQTTCHGNLNWVATATARLGYAWTPHTLFYVKGGGAWADEELSWTCNYGSPLHCANSANVVADGASVRNTRVGWTAGLGTEFAMTDRWSIKGEFDWLDFGTKSFTLSDGTAINSSLRTAQGKVGVNYRLFGP